MTLVVKDADSYQYHTDFIQLMWSGLDITELPLYLVHETSNILHLPIREQCQHYTLQVPNA